MGATGMIELKLRIYICGEYVRSLLLGQVMRALVGESSGCAQLGACGVGECCAR